MTRAITLPDQLSRSIYFFREHHVMLDADLATLYGVQVKALNQAVKRNPERFPDDFTFQLTKQELANLRSPSVTSSSHGGRRYLPFVFTEEGVAMLSSVLRSPRAARANVEIMRAFVSMRRFAASNERIHTKLDELERKFDQKYETQDKKISAVFLAIRKLIEADEHKPTLGFARNKDDAKDKRG